MSLHNAGLPDSSQVGDCSICNEKLLIPSADDEGPSAVMDDIKLQCGHHSHWSCFEEYDRNDPDNRARCPVLTCRQNTLNGQGALIVDIVNEGGFTSGVNIGEIFDRDRWEEQQPEEWKKGQAVLSLCQSQDYEEAEALLRDEGADPNTTFEDGMTGLHMAALNNSVEWASLLLRYGAEKSLKNSEGKTALDYATSASSQSIIELLQQ